jgi:hypothetical protein
MIRGLKPSREKIFFSRPKGSDWLWADPDFFTMVTLGGGGLKRQEREGPMLRIK